MSETELRDSSAFERRFGDLLIDYASTADRPFDSMSIASMAGETMQAAASWVPGRVLGRSLQRAWTLLIILALLAALAIGALVIRSQPPFPGLLRIGPEELLVTRSRENKVSTAQVVAVSVITGEARVIADGQVMEVSPDRTRIVRQTPGSLVISDASGASVAETAYPASRVAWSPDGRFVLLTNLGFYDRARGVQPASYAIWNVNSNAVVPLPFAPNARVDRAGNPVMSSGEAGAASWAPDSRHVLLATDEGLVVTDLRGELVVRVPGTARDSIGAWSPDGAYILHENRTRGMLAVLTMRPDFSSTLVATLSASSPRHASWSPDGSQIAFITDDGLAVASRDDLGRRRVLYPKKVIEGTNPLWSPDGRQLAFVAWAQNGETGWLSHALYVVDATGGDARILLSPLRTIGGIDW
jgi:WD40-like Beta Propeller Repeat